MDFDEMLETWRTQNTAPPYDVNLDALRQALETQEASVRQAMRTQRRLLWICWIVGTGMAVWAGFWIAITVANGWPAIYAIAAGACLCMFALAAVAFGMGRARESKRNFGNTLQEEVRRSLALVDDQLSVASRWVMPIAGTAALVVGTGLFCWTVVRSQDIPVSWGGGWFWFAVLIVVLCTWASFKELDQMRQAKPKLEIRRRRLGELLAVLEARASP